MLLAIVILFFPLAMGPFFAQVIAIVALFVLIGLGLNITLGLAGLLDLGFVAFFAVGAYTVALLTSTAEYGIAGWSFWQAVPFAVVFAMLFGAFLGLPILGIRGDYLAIATLGFGEIIRILAGSDLLKPLPRWPARHHQHPQADRGAADRSVLPDRSRSTTSPWSSRRSSPSWPGGCARRASAGRGSPIREDEDVAEAMGVNLVQTKLLAYMLGGGFAGLGGAIFAALVGSIFASSIQLQLSINVVAIVIVGGMGSIPGVVVGALVLIGLPELFREFSEYRLPVLRRRADGGSCSSDPKASCRRPSAKRELHADTAPDEVDELDDDGQPAISGATTAGATDGGRRIA